MDRLSEVGLGTGLAIDPSYDMAGFPNWSPKERVARLAEYVVARLMLHGHIDNIQVS